MRRLPLLLAFLIACGGHLPEPARPTDRNAKRVAATGVFTSRQTWDASPWVRLEDAVIDMPVFVVIAVDGSACVVTGNLWATARQGDAYACAGRWRLAR